MDSKSEMQQQSIDQRLEALEDQVDLAFDALTFALTEIMKLRGIDLSEETKQELRRVLDRLGEKNQQHAG